MSTHTAHFTLTDTLKELAGKAAAFFAILGAAKRAGVAAQNGRRPLARDLRLLGIAPESFPGC